MRGTRQDMLVSTWGANVSLEPAAAKRKRFHPGKSWLPLVASVAALQGCTPLPLSRPVVPDIPIPAQFKQAAAVRAELEPVRSAEQKPGGASSLGAAPVVKVEPLIGALLAQWWRTLSNPELDALVDRAIANNTDLRIAHLRIAQARARAEQAESDRWPTLSVPYQAKGEAPRGGIGTLTPGQKRETKHTYQLSLRADWRADIWGERSAMAESAQMQLVRTTYERDETRRQMISSVAAFYVEYLSLNDRVRVARETETVLRGLLSAVGKRLEVGEATITDLEQQRAAVYAVQATIPALELQRETVANSLAQLLGVTPTSLALSDRGLDSLRFSGLLPGVPASLVLHRPDVRVVEARLLSAHADIEVARARLLPPLDLTAQVGYGSLALSQLFQSHNLFWTAIANLSATIFDRGKRANEVQFASALHEELVETYIKTIYNAVRETEDAIATVQMTGKRIEAQAASVEAAQRAWHLSMEAYEAGAVDYLTMIDTERTYHRSLDELFRIRMERMKGVTALFAALGGGMVAEKNTPPPDGTVSREMLAAMRTEGHVPIGVTDEERPWLVELAGLYDRAGIPPVWRDLLRRFPTAMEGRGLLPRWQGGAGEMRRGRAEWYRLYVAAFDTETAARQVCDQLVDKLQRCRVVTREEIADDPASNLPDLPELAAIPATDAEVPVGMLGDLIVPITLHAVDPDRRPERPATMEVMPNARIVTPDDFLPALVVPVVPSVPVEMRKGKS